MAFYCTDQSNVTARVKTSKAELFTDRMKLQRSVILFLRSLEVYDPPSLSAHFKRKSRDRESAVQDRKAKKGKEENMFAAQEFSLSVIRKKEQKA